MENATMNCPLPQAGIRPDDQEVFERVWRRVMPEARESCPVVLASTDLGGDLPCACVCPRESTQLQAVEEAVSMETAAAGAHRGCDFPDSGDVPLLGRASAIHGEQLQRQVMDALECWQVYRQLARRAGGGCCARTLSAIASEKYKAARKLAAAYFLISGVRYWPADQLSAPCIPSYLGMVRRGFQAEQRREQAYRAAAADTGDAALAELYRELAGQCQEHSRSLRSLLEQSNL